MKHITLVVLVFMPGFLFGQLGVSYHQSQLPFVGLNYEIGTTFRTEVRLGTDSYFEDLSFELVGTFDLLDREEYQFYAGLGLWTHVEAGLAIPLGFNYFPFEARKFGFHIEVTPLFTYSSNILRGSWGIRYRFTGN